MRSLFAALVISAALAGTAFAQDVCAPAKVTSLHVEDVGHYGFTIEWDATGDDCSSSNAYSWELYRSTSTITDTNWQQSYPPYRTGNACPNGQEHCELVSSSCPATGYYYALFLIDDAGNRSPISNVVAGAPSCSGMHEVDCYNPNDCY